MSFILICEEKAFCDAKEFVKLVFLEMKTNEQIGVHMSHCFMEEYDCSCKYGDDYCPADPYWRLLLGEIK